jgi:pyruvate dehydrogenase E1 component
LQHQDGHSHVLALSVPTVQAYDPAFAYELAVIIQDGIRRMYEACESIFYYITLYNEPYPMIPMPEGTQEGILRGLYKLRPAPSKGKQPASGPRSKVHLFGSGTVLREALRAQEMLAERYGIATDIWSVTSYKRLRRDALEAERWNMLHPMAEPRKSYLERLLQGEQGVFIAVSDYMKLVPEMISRWVPGGLFPLGTDGFGRSDNRAALRRFFEIDAECITVGVLWRLAQRGEIKPAQVQQAIQDLGIDPEKADPLQT